MIVAAGLSLAERGALPLPVLRAGVRALVRRRLEEIESGRVAGWVEPEDPAVLAIETAAANEQHYELPPAFFQEVLGPHLKYSACYWPDGVETLGDAERASLEQVCERAALEDGQDVLELGCGWGSLSLYMAERFPNSRIVGVSNSAPQRAFIEARAPSNLEIITADVNTFDPWVRAEAGGASGTRAGNTPGPGVGKGSGSQPGLHPQGGFDRIVSVEMFEHVRNHRALFERIHRWLRPDGRLFVHVFCHRRHAYPFEVEGEDDWMGRYFFTGGVMPSFDLLPSVSGRLRVEERWYQDGTHYQRTARAWREALEGGRERVMPLLRAVYGEEAGIWFQRWRLFFLACEELFGFRGGAEWGVGHYRFGAEAR